MRARTETKNAPAEPTTARMAVGFSGELRQPSVAWRGRVTVKRRARPANKRVDFFIMVSSSEVTGGQVGCQLAKVVHRSYHLGIAIPRNVYEGTGGAA